MSVALVKQKIEHHLNQIKPHFVPGMELTFIARKPDNDRADFVVTNDSLAELAKVVERMQVQSGQQIEVATLRAELAAAKLHDCDAYALEVGRDGYLQGLERAAEIVEGFETCMCCSEHDIAADIRAETGGDESELKTLRDLERSYSQQLGEMARLCDTVAPYVMGLQTIAVPPAVRAACEEIVEYVEAVRPPEGSEDPQWVVHILGPDDVIDCTSQFDALRQANEINKAFAKFCADDPSPNNPHCWAVVKTKEEVGL